MSTSPFDPASNSTLFDRDRKRRSEEEEEEESRVSSEHGEQPRKLVLRSAFGVHLLTARPALEEAATQLLRDDYPLVAGGAEKLRREAEEDHRAGSPRGRAMVRRLRGMLIDQPELGLAVARELGLEHIALDLLEGRSVDGVSGLALDGTPLRTSRGQRSKRHGAWMLAASGLILLLEAIVAGGVGSILLYAWTAVGLGLFFAGGYLVIYRG